MADYSFSPQFANLSGLQPLPALDVTRGAALQFQPLQAIQIQSSRPELVAEGIAGAVSSIAKGALGGITAKYEKEEEKEERKLKFAHEIAIAGIRAKELDPYLEALKTRKLVAETESAENRLDAVLPPLPSGAKRRIPMVDDQPLPEFGEDASDKDTSSETDFSLTPSEAESIEPQTTSSITPDYAKGIAENVSRDVGYLSGLPASELTASIGAGPISKMPEVEPPSMTLGKVTSSLISPKQEEEIKASFEKYGVTPAVLEKPEPKRLLSLEKSEPKKEEKVKPPRAGDFDTEAQAQAEAYRDIPGFKTGTYTSEIDENGQPFFRVPPREKMTPSESAAERKAIADAQKAEMELTSKSKKGGKTPLDSQINKIIALKSTSEDLKSIAKRLNNIPEQFRGPITGFLARKNPYSAEIQALNSQIIQIIPGLARGVFGEVGVLTEKDAERYLKTIPNNQQDPKVSFEVLKELTEKLERSKKNTVSAYGKAGYDMSEFEEGYFDNEVQKAKSDEIGDLSMQLEQFPLEQRNSAEFLALRKKAYDLVYKEELQKKGTPKPAPQATPPPSPQFPLATPRTTETTETLESFLGSK
jgi:hypothetical protein